MNYNETDGLHWIFSVAFFIIRWLGVSTIFFAGFLTRGGLWLLGTTMIILGSGLYWFGSMLTFAKNMAESDDFEIVPKEDKEI